MRDRHRDVEHVDVDRVAVAARHSQPALPRLDDFRPRRVILHRRHAVRRFRGVAEHAAVARDECDSGVEKLADAVGLRVELRDERRRAFG